VVDGGASDGTAERIRQQGFRAGAAERGRAPASEMPVPATSSGALLLFPTLEHPPAYGAARPGAAGPLAAPAGVALECGALGRRRAAALVAALDETLRFDATGHRTGDQAIFSEPPASVAWPAFLTSR